MKRNADIDGAQQKIKSKKKEDEEDEEHKEDNEDNEDNEDEDDNEDKKRIKKDNTNVTARRCKTTKRRRT